MNADAGIGGGGMGGLLLRLSYSQLPASTALSGGQLLGLSWMLARYLLSRENLFTEVS